MKPNRKLLLPAAWILLTPITCISIRYLTFHFDIFTLNFFRLLSGSLVMFFVAFSRAELGSYLRAPKGLQWIALLAIIGALGQFCVVKGLARTSAAMGELICLLTIPITAVLAAVLFRDERETVTNRGFLVGAFLAVGGMIGIIVWGKALSIENRMGPVFLVAGAFFICISGLLTKSLVMNVRPLIVGSINVGIQCLLYLAMCMVLGNPGKLLAVPVWAVGILLVSGAYGIAVGVGLYYMIVQNLGIVAIGFIGLMVPPLTAILGYFLIGDSLTLGQLGSFGVVILGCFFIMRGRCSRNSRQCALAGNAAQSIGDIKLARGGESMALVDRYLKKTKIGLKIVLFLCRYPRKGTVISSKPESQRFKTR